jgi:hypothetical protein
MELFVFPLTYSFLVCRKKEICGCIWKRMYLDEKKMQ